MAKKHPFLLLFPTLHPRHLFAHLSSAKKVVTLHLLLAYPTAESNNARPSPPKPRRSGVNKPSASRVCRRYRSDLARHSWCRVLVPNSNLTPRPRALSSPIYPQLGTRVLELFLHPPADLVPSPQIRTERTSYIYISYLHFAFTCSIRKARSSSSSPPDPPAVTRLSVPSLASILRRLHNRSHLPTSAGSDSSVGYCCLHPAQDCCSSTTTSGNRSRSGVEKDCWLDTVPSGYPYPHTKVCMPSYAPPTRSPIVVSHDLPFLHTLRVGV